MQNRFTCDECPLKDKCVEPCAAVESMLPSTHRGKLNQLGRSDSQSRLRVFEDKRNATRVMLSYRGELNGRLRQVFDLTYNKALSQKEIARVLDVDRRTVARYLERAREKLYRLSVGKRADRRERAS